MNPKTKKRTKPYALVSWIKPILAGERQCVWAVWFQAQCLAAKQPSDFNFETWKVDHSALLRPLAKDLIRRGFKVTTEEQNEFKMNGKRGTLAGKPDLIAIDEDESEGAWIIDVKTGSEKLSDKIQVMIYMWAVKKYNPRFKDIPVFGKLVYAGGKEVEIRPETITDKFEKDLIDLLNEVFGAEPPAKVPSYSDCRYCPITPEDCPERVEASDLFEADTDAF